MTTPRVRIAPSPTGNLHIGTARTALFNYLFARQKGGKFVLRIEDTDQERSKDEFTKNIYDSLKAMGLQWDEGPDIGGDFGPYKQSERTEIYQEYAKKLAEDGHAYECFCTPEELEAEKQKAREEKRDYVYSRRCMKLTQKQRFELKTQGIPCTLRFEMPSRTIVVKDLIKGDVSFDSSLIGDFVIMKSNNTPTYNFAVVVDDITMKMTHIVRGEDHISNTPKQIALYEAFGAEVPVFAHNSMILAADKSKMSKRHGATAVSDFVEQGYLPEALVNFIALLGWAPPEETEGKSDGNAEIKTMEELIQLFELDKISNTPAVFDRDKLNWVNGQHIRLLPAKEIFERCKKYLTGYNLSMYSEEQLIAIIDGVRKNFTTLSDVTDAVSYFFNENFEISAEAKEQALTGEHVQNVLSEFLNLADQLDYSSHDDINEKFKDFRKSLKPLKPKFIMMPIRVALTGQMHGADLSVIIQVLGKDNIHKRINKILAVTAN